MCEVLAKSQWGVHTGWGVGRTGPIPGTGPSFPVHLCGRQVAVQPTWGGRAQGTGRPAAEERPIGGRWEEGLRGRQGSAGWLRHVGLPPELSLMGKRATWWSWWSGAACPAVAPPVPRAWRGKEPQHCSQVSLLWEELLSVTLSKD